ncbi:hypothetical protein ACG2LH_12155 [Zhouia sp. PK063]|uniref:hypothetical protein n=1 Tax=Zhouia sp. PK063 TaxID=3373602 RepID=UPI00379E0113
MAKITKSIFLIVLFGLISCNFLGAGSYPYSENYLYKFPCDTLIQRIKQFEAIHPKYKVYEKNEKGDYIEMDHYSESRIGKSNKSYKDYNKNVDSFSIYFYLEEIKGTILCSINLGEESRKSKVSILNLVAITYSKNFASWKTINTDDLSKKQNKEIKELFENKIANKLGNWIKR